MLHQPASTFEPSQAAPSTAQPFDTKRYLHRAQELGVMIFPSVARSGKRLVGYSEYPGHSFSDGPDILAKEFANERGVSSGVKPALFEALCEDFGLDAGDAAFNDKVNAICRARSQASIDGKKTARRRRRQPSAQVH